jgi:hypothetical protein
MMLDGGCCEPTPAGPVAQLPCDDLVGLHSLHSLRGAACITFCQQVGHLNKGLHMSHMAWWHKVSHTITAGCCLHTGCTPPPSYATDTSTACAAFLISERQRRCWCGVVSVPFLPPTASDCLPAATCFCCYLCCCRGAAGVGLACAFPPGHCDPVCRHHLALQHAREPGGEAQGAWFKSCC